MAAHSFHVLIHTVFKIFMLASNILHVNTSISKILAAGLKPAIIRLYWLDVPERVKYKLVTMVYNCLHGKAPSYLTDCCTPSSDVATRRHLRSASRRQLLVPRHNLSTGFFCRGSG